MWQNYHVTLLRDQTFSACAVRASCEFRLSDLHFFDFINKRWDPKGIISVETMMLCIFCFRESYKSLDAADCFHLILDSHVNTSLFRSRSVWQIMSINERIKVLWKTSCEWRDKPHFPKRRDFQLREGELEGSLLPLNVGDAAKIKFGSRWYNVEVAESWSPKSRRGMCC